MRINLLAASWWENIGASDAGTFRQIMFVLGCAMGAVLIVQIIMMLIGMGNDTSFDHDTDFDHDGSVDHGDAFNNDGAVAFGLKLLTVRSAIAFIGIASWAIFVLCEWLPWWGALLIGIALGAGASCLMALTMMSLEKLQQSGNVVIENALGKSGEVYLRIPASRAGSGKVQLTVQERVREYDAVTDSGRELKTGEKIKITGLIDDNTLLVEPFAAVNPA